VRYLLDTDIVSNLMRREPSYPLIRRLALVPPEDQCTTSITLGELMYGAHRVPDRTAVLLRRIDELIPSQLPVLPFDESAARRYGSLRAALEVAGTLIGDADMRIAAIALAHGLTVVTANVRHLGRVPGLGVEDWLAG
jgi:tRNA(fMet)-specific endonuclease VapC